MIAGYQYVTTNPLENRQSYTYSQYHGQSFIDAWLAVRQRFIFLGSKIDTYNRALIVAGLESDFCESLNAGSVIVTERVLEKLLNVPIDKANREYIDFFIQRFEVSKRLFDEYEITHTRPKSSGSYRNAENYLLLAEVLAQYFRVKNYLPALNAYLKILDSLTGLCNQLTELQKVRLSELVCSELQFVESVVSDFSRTAGSLQSDLNNSQKFNERNKQCFDLSHVTFIAADTVRTRAYALACKKAGIRFDSIIFLKSTKPKWGQANQLPAFEQPLTCGAFAADLNINLQDLLESISINVIHTTTDTINCVEVAQSIQEQSSSFIVFSGYGGEIVDVRLLAPNTPMLHIHSGYLPHFRGSTTVYYSILEENSCGASAIILEPAIDEGVILHKKQFTLPAKHEEIDYYYDSFIRADVLVETLTKLRTNAGNIDIESQKPENGVSYFVIHPVLKHLSIMKVQGVYPQLVCPKVENTCKDDD